MQVDVERLDKWLWAARFFKTRGLAAEAIAGGKVQVDERRVKPTRAVRIGTRVRVRKGEEEWDIVVAGLSRQRGPASEARLLYTETPESERRRALGRERQAEDRHERRLEPGKPSKRSRRELMRLKRS
jgi:ribosome-associated heat shock protein Hsp15